jgi:hypothetical protein
MMRDHPKLVIDQILALAFRQQAKLCLGLGSSLYDTLRQIADDVESRGVCWLTFQSASAEPNGKIQVVIRWTYGKDSSSWFRCDSQGVSLAMTRYNRPELREFLDDFGEP